MPPLTPTIPDTAKAHAQNAFRKCETGLVTTISSVLIACIFLSTYNTKVRPRK
jgi:hypothetical protein